VQIRYSQHIENRLSLRRIHYDLPRQIFEQSDERYFDCATGHFIATKKLEISGVLKEMMVAYVTEEDCAVLLTIHPLREGQKENRVAAGRWRRI